MKKIIFIAIASLGFVLQSIGQEFKIITQIESIVPMGLGRSRIVEHNEPRNYEEFTTNRETGKDSKNGKVKRGTAKIDKMAETKLLNFYSGMGINFQNIASNDAIMSDKINKMVTEGWELAFVLSGVESVGGKDDNAGIFITRYIFKK